MNAQEELARRLAQIEQELAAVRREAARAADRGDAPVETHYAPYANDRALTLDPVPPLPYADFEDTFK